MKIIWTLMVMGLILGTNTIFGQYLPSSYQPLLNEIVENFKTIRSGNSITQGKTTLSVVNDNKIALRIEHKKEVKNLTFVTKLDEESIPFWAPANALTIDMVNKFEDDITRELESMQKLAAKKSKE